jgi:Zn-dependent M16 (insulinase) family peptidase
MLRPLLATLVLTLAACTNSPHPATQQPTSAAVALADLKEHDSTHGFTPVAVYLDDAGRRMGARFVHDKTGFTFDYLKIESAPQGYIWVNSFPTSDKGEPHTQEHLLLGKGNKGRALGSSESMELAESSAFTNQWRTAYHFHTVAGHEVFWPVFRGQLDALLNPDYSDEEIRREVRNFGVAAAADGTRHLDEKGTVYQEMVRSYEQAGVIAYDELGRLIWGAGHPLARSSGGTPEALRALTAEDIRSFHDANYHLANMGMVGAFPTGMALGDVLDHTGRILDELAGRKGKVTTEADLPKPEGAARGTIEILDYPFASTANPGPMLLAWPATRKLGDADRLLLSLFLSSFAGDESTTLYKDFIDSKTRTIETGADAVSAYLSTEEGMPVYLELDNVKPEHMTRADVEAVRAEVLAKLKRIAELPDGDPELIALAERVSSRIVETRRDLAKLLNSPPRFGYRATGSQWSDYLHLLGKSPGFEKSLTQQPALAEVGKILAGGGNPWHARLAAWGLLDTPYGVAARPSPARLASDVKRRKERVDAELKRLEVQYGTTSEATTLVKYQADYDAESKVIEDAGKSVHMPPFVDNPPETLDDDLQYANDPIGGVPALTARFDGMTSARVGLAFRVDGVKQEDLPYLALLPALMREAGIYEGGQAIPADQMKEQLRRQILGLDVSYTDDLRTGRVELSVEGAGNDLAETKAALSWMGRVMFESDWRQDNLARLRDVVDQSLAGYRQVMQGPEEAWVEGPRNTYWRQGWPQLLHTDAAFTQAHDIFRLRWMLMPGETQEVDAALTTLAGAAELTRAQLGELAAALQDRSKPLAEPLKKFLPGVTASAETRKVLAEAGKDLAAMLPDIPGATLSADWAALVGEMRAGLQSGPAAALAALVRVRAAVLAQGNARAYLLGSAANVKSLEPEVAALAGRLDTATPVRQHYAAARSIDARLADHEKAPPTFIGLVDPDTQSGVFLNSAPGASYLDTDESKLLDFLTIHLYSGHGAHSLFMKTWAAGLAYSNGAHSMPRSGRIEYYAERSPQLPTTLQFVIAELQKAKVDPDIAAYAIAGAYNSRVADSYEDRTRAMAEDLADGITPAAIRAFRAKLAALRTRKDLAGTLFGRMAAVYGSIMPGYPGGPAPADLKDGVFFVIGPDAQLDAYQQYLKTAVGKNAVVDHLYPRDYWVP